MSIDLTTSIFPASSRKTMIATLATILMMLLGCGKKQSANVVALVNGQPILRSELDKTYEAQERQTQDHGAETQEEVDSNRVAILQSMINAEIVEQRAAQMKLTATDDEVTEKIAEMKARFTKEQFDQWLQQTNQPGQRELTNPLVQQTIRDQLWNSRSQLAKATYLEILSNQAKVENYLAQEVYKRTTK